ncbi:MAG: polysaccharide deacetylase family protein [Acutalibacter sp.]|jgi:hypothetical protein
METRIGMLFPQGKERAVTLSYDDGFTHDRKLVELLNQYGLKCTFNLNSGLFGTGGEGTYQGKPLEFLRITGEEAATLYQGHEVAGHGLHHCSLTSVPGGVAMEEIVEDKRRLEELTGQVVRSFAYAYGDFDARAVELLGAAGYASARTVVSTGRFDIPQDFLTWPATCHHDDPRLMELVEEFLAPIHPGDRNRARLFYLWGHSFELAGNGNWEVVERFAQRMAAKGQDLWFATNGEIVEYVTAYRRLEWSADGSRVRNPSALEVWVLANVKTVSIPGGACVALS